MDLLASGLSAVARRQHGHAVSRESRPERWVNGHITASLRKDGRATLATVEGASV